MGAPVSIIVPVKNEAKNIKRFIEGIKKQKYRPIEVLFVDGGSTDETAIEKIVNVLHESEHAAITFVPNMHT